MQKITKSFKHLIILLIFVLLIIFVYSKYNDKVSEVNTNDYKWLNKHININKSGKIHYIDKNDSINIYSSNYRKVINEKLNKLINQSYSINSPLIIYNMYGTNNLSVNIYYSTPRKSSTSYTISVDDINIDDFTKKIDNEYKINHKYQIVGLVSGYINNIKIISTTKDGVVTKKNYEIDLRNLNNSKEILSIEDTDNNNKLIDGLYTVTRDKYISIYDNNGIIRSEIPTNYHSNRILLDKNNMYINISNNKIVKINNLGEVIDVYNTGDYTIGKDYVLNDNNILFIGTNKNNNTSNDQLLKINLKTHEITNIIDFTKLFKSFYEKQNTKNWLNLNSIDYSNNDVILSSKSTSSIIKITNINKNPTIKYILGNKELYNDTDLSKYIYNQKGDFILHNNQMDVKNNLTLMTNTESKDKTMFYEYKINEDKHEYELTKYIDLDYSTISSSQIINNNVIISLKDKQCFYEYDNYNKLIRKFNTDYEDINSVYKYTFSDYWFK